MRRSVSRGIIRPKISTMPRQKSEAAAFLNIYKLVIEKKRLQEELQSLEERRQQIQQRMTVLDKQVTDLEGTVKQMREKGELGPALQQLAAISSDLPETFNMLFLEY